MTHRLTALIELPDGRTPEQLDADFADWLDGHCDWYTTELSPIAHGPVDASPFGHLPPAVRSAVAHYREFGVSNRYIVKAAFAPSDSPHDHALADFAQEPAQFDELMRYLTAEN